MAIISMGDVEDGKELGYRELKRARRANVNDDEELVGDAESEEEEAEEEGCEGDGGEEEAEEEKEEGFDDEEEEEEVVEKDKEEEEEEEGGGIEKGESDGGEENEGNGSISLALTKPVLDCIMCNQPLTIPVFQCKNGHTACCSCCSKLAHKCPSCSLPIVYNRCRAIEKVLDSATIPCIYAPCPVPGCSFVSSSEQLYRHLSSRHAVNAKRFQYNRTITLSFNRGETSLLLQEEKEGVIFILKNTMQTNGNMITVSCIGPLSNGGYRYELSANTEKNSLTFQSLTQGIRSRVDNPLKGFLLVPSGIFGEQITLDLCIWCKDACPSCIQRSMVAV